MSDKELVIKIPEELYEKIRNLPNFISADAIQLIRDGIPLPKGHGDLVDRDALEKEIVNGIKAGNYEEGYETFAHINDMDDCIECVKYADTIIEADKENKKYEHMTVDELAELFIESENEK